MVAKRKLPFTTPNKRLKTLENKVRQLPANSWQYKYVTEKAANDSAYEITAGLANKGTQIKVKKLEIQIAQLLDQAATTSRHRLVVYSYKGQSGVEGQTQVPNAPAPSGNQDDLFFHIDQEKYRVWLDLQDLGTIPEPAEPSTAKVLKGTKTWSIPMGVTMTNVTNHNAIYFQVYRMAVGGSWGPARPADTPVSYKLTYADV